MTPKELVKSMKLKLIASIVIPCTSDLDLNPRNGTRTQPKPRLGLEPTVL